MSEISSEITLMVLDSSSRLFRSESMSEESYPDFSWSTQYWLSAVLISRLSLASSSFKCWTLLDSRA